MFQYKKILTDFPFHEFLISCQTSVGAHHERGQNELNKCD